MNCGQTILQVVLESRWVHVADVAHQNHNQPDFLNSELNVRTVQVVDDSAAERTCLYCGTSNSEERDDCIVCHSSFIPEEEIAQAEDELLPVATQPDMTDLQVDFEEENGLSHPNWRKMYQQISASRAEADWWDIYHELAKQWLLRLKADLGGYYHVYESENFVVLSAEGATATRTIIGYAESSLAVLQRFCRGIQPEETYGKRAMLIFTDQDDYYAYVSHFHRDGAHSLSAGTMLSRGYMHIAFPFTWIFSARRIITHELVHNCIAHLRIPSWLHEGVAQKLERLVMNTRAFVLEHELAMEHHAHWTEQNIQEFWSGASFYVGDERNKLSYSLAEILTEFLSSDWNAFLEFISQADYRDAGQDAALRTLHRCLGETIGQFLGPGNWRPQRMAIAERMRDLESKSERV